MQVSLTLLIWPPKLSRRGTSAAPWAHSTEPPVFCPGALTEEEQFDPVTRRNGDEPNQLDRPGRFPTGPTSRAPGPWWRAWLWRNRLGNYRRRLQRRGCSRSLSHSKSRRYLGQKTTK